MAGCLPHLPVIARMPDTTPHHVLLAGSTGLTGGFVLQALKADASVQRIVAPTRHPLPMAARLENPVGPLQRLLPGLTPPMDIAICCLGTTIKHAGSREAFRMTDFDLPVAIGMRARRLGARHYVVISSLGADATARTFYTRVKGEMELALRKQDWPQLTIVRPSLIVGQRQEFRLGERLATPLSLLLPGRWRGIRVESLARAIWRLACTPGEGVRVVESEELRQIGA